MPCPSAKARSTAVEVSSFNARPSPITLSSTEATLFAVGTRRLRFRWVVAIALPVVVLCTWAFTAILANFGYAAVLDGP